MLTQWLIVLFLHPLARNDQATCNPMGGLHQSLVKALWPGQVHMDMWHGLGLRFWVAASGNDELHRGALLLEAIVLHGGA